MVNWPESMISTGKIYAEISQNRRWKSGDFGQGISTKISQKSTTISPKARFQPNHEHESQFQYKSQIDQPDFITSHHQKKANLQRQREGKRRLQSLTLWDIQKPGGFVYPLGRDYFHCWNSRNPSPRLASPPDIR